MAVFTALAIAGIGLSAYGQIRSGMASKRAGSAQREAAESGAELQDYNARVADLQAKDARERGAEQESGFRMGVRSMVGSQRAGFAAGNIDVAYGSAADVQADATMLGELDALTIRTNAAREAWGFKVQADDLRKRAKIARKEGVYLEAAGRANAQAAYAGAAGTVLSGASSLYQARYGFQSH
jgi:hypothetical protein